MTIVAEGSTEHRSEDAEDAENADGMRTAVCPLGGVVVAWLFNRRMVPGASYLDGWHHTACLDEYFSNPQASDHPLPDEDCTDACGYESRCTAYQAGQRHERDRIVRSLAESGLLHLAALVERDEL